MTFSIIIEKKLLELVEESTCDALTKIMLKEKLLFYYDLDRNKVEYSDDSDTESVVESIVENDVENDVENNIENNVENDVEDDDCINFGHCSYGEKYIDSMNNDIRKYNKNLDNLYADCNTPLFYHYHSNALYIVYDYHCKDDYIEDIIDNLRYGDDFNKYVSFCKEQHLLLKNKEPELSNIKIYKKIIKLWYNIGRNN